MQTHHVTRDQVPLGIPILAASSDGEPSGMLRRFAGGISRIAFAVFGTVTPPSSQSTTPALPELELPADETNRSMKHDPEEMDVVAVRALVGPSRLSARPRTPVSPARRRLAPSGTLRRFHGVSNRSLYLSSPSSGFTPQLMPLPVVSPINSRESSVARKSAESRQPMTAAWIYTHPIPEKTGSTTRLPKKESGTPSTSPSPFLRRRLPRTPQSVPLASSSARPSTGTRARSAPRAPNLSLRHPYRTPTKTSTMKAVAADPLRPIRSRPGSPKASISSGQAMIYPDAVASRPRRVVVKHPLDDDPDTPRTPKRARRHSPLASAGVDTEHRYASHTSSSRSSLKRGLTVKEEEKEPYIPSTVSKVGSTNWNSSDEDEPDAERCDKVLDDAPIASVKTSASTRAKTKNSRCHRNKRRRLDTADDAAEADEVAARLCSSSSSEDEHSVGSTHGDDPFDDVREPADPGLRRSIAHLATHLGVGPSSLRSSAASCPPALPNDRCGSLLTSREDASPGARSAPVGALHLHALVADPVKLREVRESAPAGSGQALQAALLAAALEAPAPGRKEKGKQRR